MGFLINPYLVQPSGPSYDADAQAFFTAAGITDTTQKSAVNQLVLDLKSYSIWTKMKALYPFVGGTSTTHSYNLKNTAQYQLTFNGGGTHASTGWTPNGTNGYANTGLIPSTSLTKFSEHFSLYSRTNNKRDVFNGARQGGAQATSVALRSTDAPNGAFYFWSYCWTCSSIYVNNTDSSGLFLVTDRASNDREAYRNGSSIASNTYDMTPYDQTSIEMYLASNNVNGTATGFDNKELAFASLGDGLTDTEAANFYTAVQTFQTTLSRSV